MKKFCILFSLFFITQKVICQQWVSLGSEEQTSSPIIQTGALTFFTQVSNDGIPYITYIDDLPGGNNVGDFKVHAVRFNGSQWEFADDGISPPFPGSDDFPVALDGNIPYVAYSEGFNPADLQLKLTVRRLNSNTGQWDVVGQQGLSDSAATGTAIAADNGKIYVAYNDAASNGKIAVKFYDNSNPGNGWQTVGTTAVSNRFGIGINIAVDNGIPYIAYFDFTDHSLFVKKFNGNTWEDVGTNSPSNGEPVVTRSLKFNSGHIPFISFIDSTGKGVVRNLNAANAWETTGDQAFASGIEDPISLAILHDIPFVTFGVKENGTTQLHVKKFNGAGNNWPDVGSQPITASTVDVNNAALVTEGNNKLLLVFRNLNEGIYAKSFDASGVLPVSLTAFTVSRQNNKSLLQWTTAAEPDNKLFEIEHSTDGATFKKIGEEAAKTPADIQHDYSFVHADPANGENYYRLKQVDKNGTYTYSKIINIAFIRSLISLSPNPVKDVLNAKNLTPGRKEIVIRNIEGKIITRLNSNSTSIDISTANLRHGTYFITFSGDAGIETRKFIK